MLLYELLLIILGFLFNLLLISVFILRKYQKWRIIRILGICVAFLIIPAIIEIIFVIIQDGDPKLIIFLWIFVGYLIIETLFDLILRIDFRGNWKLLIPYLIFYYTANYSVVMMVWSENQIFGPILAGLAILQIVVNFWSHPPFKKKKNIEN